jgi:hypothetical protein
MGDVWSMDPLRAGAAAAAVAAGGVACLCCVIPEPPAEPSAAPPAAPPPAAPPADDAGAAMGDLLRAQALVERLRPVALAFQEATLRSKAESQRQLDAAEGELAAFVRQHAAHVRNRDASLRLLRGLRIVMDVMLGAEMPTDDDSWSESEGESEDESEGDVAAKIAARLQAIEREATLLEKRAQRLPSDPAAPSSVPGRAPTVESRGQLLQDEAAALGAAVLDPPAGSTSARMRALAVLVDDLRVAEGSFEFQRTLMQAHQRLGSTTAYSRDNFAYGSTPWQSWIKVHTDPGCRELAAAVQRCAAAGSALPEYVVFGSSLGWLCFYAAFSLSVRAVGYEIVDPLVEMAEQLRSRHCCGDVAGAGCSIAFHCQVSYHGLHLHDSSTTVPTIIQYSTVQYSTVQYSTVQYSTVQYSTVQYSTVEYSTVQYSTVQVQYGHTGNSPIVRIQVSEL